MITTVSPDLSTLQKAKRIHFSGFDKEPMDKLAYRFCDIEKQSTDLIYNRCDAEMGSSGAGMYVRYFIPELNRWHRKVVGIFSGNMHSNSGDKSERFNVGVRITKRKYMSICYWVHANAQKCKNNLVEQLHRRPFLSRPAARPTN